MSKPWLPGLFSVRVPKIYVWSKKGMAMRRPYASIGNNRSTSIPGRAPLINTDSIHNSGSCDWTSIVQIFDCGAEWKYRWKAADSRHDHEIEFTYIHFWWHWCPESFPDIITTKNEGVKFRLMDMFQTSILSTAMVIFVHPHTTNELAPRKKRIDALERDIDRAEAKVPKVS